MPRLAIAQIRPTKGEYAANLQRIGGVLAQLAQLEPRVDLLIFPETSTSGYFVEGGVRDVAVTAGTPFRDLPLQHETAKAPATALAGGFFPGVPEPVLQLLPVRFTRQRVTWHPLRAPQSVPAHLRSVRRRALRGARARRARLRHGLGPRGDPDLRGRLALDHRDDRGARGRPAHPRAERLARPRHRAGRGGGPAAGPPRAVGADSAHARRRARRVRGLRQSGGVRGGQRVPGRVGGGEPERRHRAARPAVRGGGAYGRPGPERVDAGACGP